MAVPARRVERKRSIEGCCREDIHRRLRPAHPEHARGAIAESDVENDALAAGDTHGLSGLEVPDHDGRARVHRDPRALPDDETDGAIADHSRRPDRLATSVDGADVC